MDESSCFASGSVYNGILFYTAGNKVYRLDFTQEGGSASVIYTHPQGTITSMEFAKPYKSTPAELYPDLAPYYKDELDSDQMNMLKCITDLRRKEFCQEGMRWFDVKRFHIPVTHNIYGSSEKMELTADDARRVLQIPQSALSYGMEPNAR